MMKMKYPKMDWGTMEAVVNKLGGVEGVNKFLRGDLTVSSGKRAFKVWKTLKSKTGLKSLEDFKRVLEDIGGRIDDMDYDILSKVVLKFDQEEKEIAFVIVSPADLGFTQEVKLSDFYRKVQNVGLKRCSIEDVLRLRMNYWQQQKDEWLMVATEHIAVTDDILCLFTVANQDGVCCLDVANGDPDHLWETDTRFVFRQSSQVV